MDPSELHKALQQAGRPLGVREILRAARLSPGRRTEIKRALRELVRRGEVRHAGNLFSISQAGRPSPPAGGRRVEPGRRPRGKRIEGILRVNRAGFGFVETSEGEDVYVPAAEARRALDKDRVSLEVVPGADGRRMGRLLGVVERRRRMAVGVYRERGRAAMVEPMDERLPPLSAHRTTLARDGDVVKAHLGVGAGLLRPGEPLAGEVVASLGRPGDPAAEVLGAAYSQGFQDDFPPEVQEEAQAAPSEVSGEEARAEGRVDLRGMPLVTIDGEDARDFDDAVYVEERPSGWRLVVAIADVSHYVRAGSAIDAEAFRRGTSVYLPDRVLPMLPERLSNGICSLNPGEDRLCMVADLSFDRRARLRASELYPGVMRSAARCTYTEVHRVLSGERVEGRSELRPLLEHAMRLARALHSVRIRRGAIDFDLPETKVVLDDSGHPLRMARHERHESHRLVEECMLAANEAVARFFREGGLPSVFRYHGEPDPAKLAAFAELARVHGFQLPEPGQISSKELNAFLEQLEGHREERALNQLLLRSMMQAVYSAEEVGHYGLAAEHYLHFTSPIRRYPDLIVHRLLKEHWAHPRRKGREEEETKRLQAVAAHSSERERAAIQAEREVVSYYAALMMKDRVGEELDGTVSSLATFGFFVELDNLFIEGLVKGESLEPRFRFDQRLHLLAFGSGRKVRVGERVRVRIASCSLARRQIDLEVVAFPQAAPASRPRRSPREKK
ncbi:MAG: ribonuclease R [Myxococcales bacterium]|nr:ribonuclease R [Myxococcales bacterium]